MSRPATADTRGHDSALHNVDGATVPWPFLLALVLQNLAIFRGHYFNGAGFPWDFSIAYYAMVAFWTTAVGGGTFPQWMPFQQMGYPFALQLQAGMNYLPLWAFPLFKIPYTLHAAVVFQCLHILFGSVGMFLLARIEAAIERLRARRGRRVSVLRRLLFANDLTPNVLGATARVGANTTLDAVSVNGVFRSWLLPAGTYTMDASFEFPRRSGLWFVTILSVLLWTSVVLVRWRGAPRLATDALGAVATSLRRAASPQKGTTSPLGDTSILFAVIHSPSCCATRQRDCVVGGIGSGLLASDPDLRSSAGHRARSGMCDPGSPWPQQPLVCASASCWHRAPIRGS